MEGGLQVKGEKGGWDSHTKAGTLHAFGMHVLASRSDARTCLHVTHCIQLPKDEGLSLPVKEEKGGWDSQAKGGTSHAVGGDASAKKDGLWLTYCVTGK